MCTAGAKAEQRAEDTNEGLCCCCLWQSKESGPRIFKRRCHEAASHGQASASGGQQHPQKATCTSAMCYRGHPAYVALSLSTPSHQSQSAQQMGTLSPRARVSVTGKEA